MRIKKIHWIGIICGVVLVVLGSIFFFTQGEKNVFLFFLGLALTAVALPFVTEIVFQNKREQEINQMFLEFSRNLAESVATGTPISKSIVNMSQKNYGALSPYIVKLANQISLGIPLNKAFQIFAKEVDNPVISRAVSLIGEAERAGGEIDNILESVAKSISEIEKLRNERKAAISSLIVQGYIIFFIFIGIMLVMEFKILPLAIQVNSITGISQGTINTVNQPSGISQEGLADLFLYLLLAQGFFTGLAIGKLAEGSLRAGIKHSFILTVSAILISTGIRAIFA